MTDSILSVFRQDHYRFGDCHIRVYDRRNISLYGSGLLRELYQSCLDSAPSRPHGTLDVSFCGMADLTFDSISAYLYTRNPLLLMCVDAPGTPRGFDIAGFSFPTVWCGQPVSNLSSSERSALVGYTIFRPWWGQPEPVVLSMLALAYYFEEFNLKAIHGQRYPFNHLTAKFCSQFGFKDVGTVPEFMLAGDKLVGCTVSTLIRSDFESYVRLTLAGIV